MKHAISALCCTAVALMGCAGTSSSADGPQANAASAGGTTINSHSSSGFNAPKAEATTQEAERMAWWNDARFGMFIHWGVYSVPAGTWNGKTTNGTSEWLMQGLKVPTSEYVKFADGFTADKYDPADWAKLAKQAGMKYIVITSRHHDGFCLWDSAVSDWDVMASPAKRDLLKPLADATRAEGLHFCTYYSILDWRHPDYEPVREWNNNPHWRGGPGYKRDYQGKFVPYVRAQVAEVIKDVDPDVLWFDGEWEDTWTEQNGIDLYNEIRALKPSIIINNRVGKSRNDMQGFTKKGTKAVGDFCTPEQEVPATGLPGVAWETCMTMNTSWGFKSSDHEWKSATQIVRTLCDVASKGGNFLLNVGPRPDGTIPQESVDRLQEVGRWMAVNGDAIYGTTASPFKKLDWGRATLKGNTLNLFVFNWPDNPTGKLEIPGLKNKVNAVRVVALDKMLRSPVARTTESGAEIARLGNRPGGFEQAMPVLIQLTLDGPPHVVIPPAPAIQRSRETDTYTLAADQAEIDGSSLRVQGETTNHNLGYWTNNADKASWLIANAPPGKYRLELDLACQPSDAGSAFEVAVGNALGDAPAAAVVKGVVPDTGSWGTFKTVSLEGLRLTEGFSKARVEVRAASDLKGGLMNLKAVRLIKLPD